MQEGWRGEEAGENLRLSTVSAGAGGVVAVIVRVLGGGEGGGSVSPSSTRRTMESRGLVGGFGLHHFTYLHLFIP